MSEDEVRKFAGDFIEALVKLALERVAEVDFETKIYAEGFDRIAESLDWSDYETLAQSGIHPDWVDGRDTPHRTLMHPDFVVSDTKWPFVRDYLLVSMLSKKQLKILVPNLTQKRRPRVEVEILLAEARVLNNYLHLVQESGLTGDRIVAYRGDLRTHGRGQNDSGRIGAMGAAVAIRDAIEEIRSTAIVSTSGDMPPRTQTTPADLVEQMTRPDFAQPKAILLDSERAAVFASDPDVAIISRIGGAGQYSSAQEAFDEWQANRRNPAEERQASMHQAALGEVKTALDVSNMHERLALGSRESREEAHAIRFLMMAILTMDIINPDRVGRRAMYSRDAQRFQHVFNLYFLWGDDGARHKHRRHWEDFKTELARWCGLR
jgi:hypothetical protein